VGIFHERGFTRVPEIGYAAPVRLLQAFGVLTPTSRRRTIAPYTMRQLTAAIAATLELTRLGDADF
jgi:hypothetical protein